jgi:hypothetical protein
MSRGKGIRGEHHHLWSHGHHGQCRLRRNQGRRRGLRGRRHHVCRAHPRRGGARGLRRGHRRPRRRGAARPHQHPRPRGDGPPPRLRRRPAASGVARGEDVAPRSALYRRACALGEPPGHRRDAENGNDHLCRYVRPHGRGGPQRGGDGHPCRPVPRRDRPVPPGGAGGQAGRGQSLRPHVSRLRRGDASPR